MASTYKGHLAKTVINLKRLSLTSSLLAVVSTPVFVVSLGRIRKKINIHFARQVMGDSSIPLVVRAGISGTVAMFGLGSTGLLSFMFKPYVSEMKIERPASIAGKMDNEVDTDELAKTKITATTFSFWTLPVKTSFELGDVKPPGMRPFVTFSAKGKPFYVHEDLIKDDRVRSVFVAAKNAS